MGAVLGLEKARQGFASDARQHPVHRLDDGHLFAAACDVLPSEPLPPDHRILRTSKITVTPHLAGASKSAAWIAARLGAADIAAYARGERAVNLLNPEVLDA